VTLKNIKLSVHSKLKKLAARLMQLNSVVITRDVDLSSHTFFCKDLPHETICHNSLGGAKSKGVSGFLVYGPYVEILEATTYAVELSYLTANKKGKYAGKFDINLSKKNNEGTFDFVKAEESLLNFTSTRIKNSTLYFDSSKYIGYKVEFRVFVEAGVDLYAFQIKTQKVSKSQYDQGKKDSMPFQIEHQNSSKDYRRLHYLIFRINILLTSLITKPWVIIQYPHLLKKSFLQNRAKAFDKIYARFISWVSSIDYKNGEEIKLPIRLDHLPKQVKSQFYNNFEVIKTELLCNDRDGIHPMQLPSVCFNHMPRYKNGLYQRVWTKDMVEEMKALAIHREDYSCESYPESVLQHYTAFDKINVKGKRTMVVGSVSPWIESILLAYKAKEVLTVEYGHIPYNGESIKIIDPLPLNESYDIVCSFSSIEHNGLGRYGDPIDPMGDICTMNEIFDVLVPGGIALIGIPVCKKNVIVGNGHRTYSKYYTEYHLFKKFKILDTVAYPFGATEINYTKNKLDWQNQPIFILQKM